MSKVSHGRPGLDTATHEAERRRARVKRSGVTQSTIKAPKDPPSLEESHYDTEPPAPLHTKSQLDRLTVLGP